MPQNLSAKPLDIAPLAVVVGNSKAVIVHANEEACRSLGYTQEELAGKHVSEFVVGLDPASLEKISGRLRACGSATFRAVHRHKDGATVPVDTHLALVTGWGPPHVVASFRDATVSEAARLALEQSEARYRKLVELLPEGVVTLGPDARITFLNAAVLRMIGANHPDELLGKPAIDFVHPDSRGDAVARIGRALKGSVEPIEMQRLVRIDGSSFWAESTSAGTLEGGSAIVVLRDVSERRRAEEEHAGLLERLRQSERIEALGTLAGGVAHDFNNVLAAILGNAEALVGELPHGSLAREDAEQIAAAARRAKGVVHQILAFARRRPFEAAPVDVARCVRENLPLVRAATPASVEIAVRANPAAGSVRADPTQLHQVLLNLCANARDAMQVQGGILEIAVDRVELPSAGAPPGLPPGGYVRLAVSDTGHGMDEATRARAYEPYFTTKPIGAGSGLGLSVVHGIVTGLGGAITLQSAVGEGTRIEVWLPRLAGEVPAASPAPPAPAPAPTRRRVLLVDDDPPVARALARMMGSLGYDVTTDGSAEEALERIRAAPDAFEVVVTDQTLPRMAGAELTRALLSIRPDLPVLICTGYSARIDEAGARAIGARALLSKPIDLRELGSALSAALEQR